MRESPGGGGLPGGSVPGAEVAENPLDDPGIVNDGDDLHWVLAHRAPQRVHVPNTEDQVAPPLGGQFRRGVAVKGPVGAAPTPPAGATADKSDFKAFPPHGLEIAVAPPPPLPPSALPAA